MTAQREPPIAWPKRLIGLVNHWTTTNGSRW
jgi:hypothetical protein